MSLIVARFGLATAEIGPRDCAAKRSSSLGGMYERQLQRGFGRRAAIAQRPFSALGSDRGQPPSEPRDGRCWRESRSFLNAPRADVERRRQLGLLCAHSGREGRHSGRPKPDISEVRM